MKAAKSDGSFFQNADPQTEFDSVTATPIHYSPQAKQSKHLSTLERLWKT
jgi:hypothetical protein